MRADMLYGIPPTLMPDGSIRMPWGEIVKP